MANKRRVFRVAERIRDVLAMEILQLSDPRLELVTITSVMVTPDLRLAKAYWAVSCVPEAREQRSAEVQEALDAAAPYLKRLVGQELSVKFVPELRFYYDETLDEQERIASLLARVRDEDRARGGSDE